VEEAVYLIDAAVVTSGVDISREAPELWRQVRRFNLPVQLALLAGHRVAASASDPSSAALVSIAPCRGGSPELDRWLESALPGSGREFGAVPRMNPVLTLHVVDNLLLSGFAIYFGNRAYCLGLGGASGQAWSALEVVMELLKDGGEHTEVVVMACDRLESRRDEGWAMLYSTRPGPYRLLKSFVEADYRARGLAGDSCSGLIRWLHSLLEGARPWISSFHRRRATRWTR
jgi:hypothetical protein